jgi:ribosome-binding factor A
MSVHHEQVVSVLTRAVQNVLSRGLNDPRVRGMASVTSVRVSRDLNDATVMVSVLPEEQAELTVHGLRHAASHIRNEVGKQVRMRRLPHLTFKLDESLKKQAGVLAAIQRAVDTDGAGGGPDPAPTPAPNEAPEEDNDP